MGNMIQAKESVVTIEIKKPKRMSVPFISDGILNDDMSNLERMNSFSLYYGKENYTKYVVEGSIIGCTYGLEKTRIGITQDHAVLDENGNAILTCNDCVAGENVYSFGICCSSKVKSSDTITIIRPAPHVNRIVTGPKCRLVLTTKWVQDKAHTHIWNHATKQYEEVLMSKATLTCLYGQGLITIQEVNNAVQGTKKAPYNDFKTISNTNLIGIGASKEYITLQQLQQFNFEYDRHTYIDKLESLTAEDFQEVVTHVIAYLNEIQTHLDYLENVFSYISDQDIIKNFNYHIEKYGIGKYEESVLMFMAVTAQESLYGMQLAEGWSVKYSYAYNQRGAGYSQLTGITRTNSAGNHVPFLTSVGYTNDDIANMVDLPFHIGTYLPFSSACYAWVKGNGISCDITTNIVEYGINVGAEMKLIYLAVCCAINGLYKLPKLKKMMDGKVFTEPDEEPYGWSDRKRSFNNAIDIFPHGKSIFVKF